MAAFSALLVPVNRRFAERSGNGRQRTRVESPGLFANTCSGLVLNGAPGYRAGIMILAALVLAACTVRMAYTGNRLLTERMTAK